MAIPFPQLPVDNDRWRFKMLGVKAHGVVLVAEAHTMVRNLIRRLLEEAGFHVLAAADGTEVLALLSWFQGRIDVVLADMEIWRVDHPQLREHMQRLRPETSLILMSALMEEDAEYQQAAHLSKPFSPQELVAKVELLIGSAS